MPIVTAQEQSPFKWVEIGRIRKGAPKQEKRPGQDLKFFRIDSADPEVNRRFTEVFGSQPTSFRAILPYDDVDALLRAYYERWDGPRLLARSDGQTVNRWYDASANCYRTSAMPVEEYNARFRVAAPEKEWRPNGLLSLLVPQVFADGAAGVLVLVTHSIIDIATLYGNLGVVRRVYGQLEGAPVIVQRTPMKLTVPNPKDGSLVVTEKWMVSLAVDAAAMQKRYANGAFLPSDNGAAAALPAGRPQLVVGKGDGSAGDEYESLTVSVQRDEDDIAEVIDDDADDLFSDKEKFVAAMERAPNPEAAVGAVQAWVPRYKKANVHQAKNALKSVSDSLGFKAWPVNSRNGAVDLAAIRRMIAEALWAYAILRDTGTESAEALSALAQG